MSGKLISSFRSRLVYSKAPVILIVPLALWLAAFLVYWHASDRSTESMKIFSNAIIENRIQDVFSAVALNDEARFFRYDPNDNTIILIYDLLDCDACMIDILEVLSNVDREALQVVVFLASENPAKAGTYAHFYQIKWPLFWVDQIESLCLQLQSTPAILQLRSEGLIAYFADPRETKSNLVEFLNQ